MAGGEEGMRRTTHGRDAGSSDDVSTGVSVRGRNSLKGCLAGDITALPGEQNAQTGHEGGVIGIGRAQ